MDWSHERIGDILLREHLITEEQLTEALKVQRGSGQPLGKILIEQKIITEEQLAKALAAQKNLPVISLSEYQVDPRAAALISERVARRHMAIPIGYEKGKLVLAMANPLDVHAVDDLRVITGYEIKPVVCTESEIVNAINRYLLLSVEKAAESAAAEVEEVAVQKLKKVTEEAPIVKLADQIISEAVTQEASDIHIEPQEKDFKVRYRVDGVLHNVMSIPKKLQPGLLSRLKIMSELDITEHRLPQDGRCGLNVREKEVDLRVATLPGIYGENITIRILDKSQAIFKLEELGFGADMLEKFKLVYSKPYGAILVTGPTGSGKSTTLYATLNILNSPEKKIITVEDPVEYRLPGIVQVQANPKIGLTFANGLRSIVRCDPDIIMIGEIRDLETAQIAVESALTGHLVLSTLHTNDASSALTRLIEMGVEPFLVSSAIDCVLAQRLARRLCSECKEAYKPSDEILRENFPDCKGDLVIYRAKGCRKCLNTGYKGRIGIYELMLVSDEVGRICVEKRSSEEIKKVAIQEGMRTLRENGLEKVKEGKTSIEEVLRVVV